MSISMGAAVIWVTSLLGTSGTSKCTCRRCGFSNVGLVDCRLAGAAEASGMELSVGSIDIADGTSETGQSVLRLKSCVCIVGEVDRLLLGLDATVSADTIAMLSTVLSTVSTASGGEAWVLFRAMARVRRFGPRPR